MKNLEKTAVIAAPAIAYASVLGGLEVKTLTDECGDTVVTCVSGAWCSAPTAHRVRVQVTPTGITYIKVSGVRVRLEDIIRV